jgi:Flp pilus assembly pilin Flp
MDLIIKFAFDEAGASAVEYSLLIALITLAIVTGVTQLGPAVAKLYIIPWP